MSKGSDLFYEPFKGDAGRPPPYKGKAERRHRAVEYHDTQSHVCLQDAALLFGPP